MASLTRGPSSRDGCCTPFSCSVFSISRSGQHHVFRRTGMTRYSGIRKYEYPEIRIPENSKIWIFGYPEIRKCGFQKSGFSEIRRSVFWKFRNSDFSEIRRSGFPEIRKSMFLEFWKNGNQDFRKSGLLEVRIFGILEFRISGSPGFLISRHPEFRISGFSVVGGPDFPECFILKLPILIFGA